MVEEARRTDTSLVVGAGYKEGWGVVRGGGSCEDGAHHGGS